MIVLLFYYIILLPKGEGKIRYKQNNGFLLAKNIRKRFIFASMASSGVIDFVRDLQRMTPHWKSNQIYIEYNY